MTDPIAALVSALQRDGRVPLAWVVEWSQGGRDPVAAAWEASRDGMAMLALVERLLGLGERYVVLYRALAQPTGPMHACMRASWTPPPLSALLAASP